MAGNKKKSWQAGFACKFLPVLHSVSFMTSLLRRQDPQAGRKDREKFRFRKAPSPCLISLCGRNFLKHLHARKGRKRQAGVEEAALACSYLRSIYASISTGLRAGSPRQWISGVGGVRGRKSSGFQPQLQENIQAHIKMKQAAALPSKIGSGTGAPQHHPRRPPPQRRCRSSILCLTYLQHLALAIPYHIFSSPPATCLVMIK